MTNLTLPKAVLWDLDGTLIDSEGYWSISEMELASRYQGDWSEGDGNELTGMSLPESCAIIREKMQIDDLSPLEIAEELTSSVLRNLAATIPWRPGALELLDSLGKAGVPQVMVTMSMRRMAMTVANAAASQLGYQVFTHVVAGDDVSRGKPHPEPYLHAAALLGLEPSDCVAIEDSLNGIRSAEAAGTRALVIPHSVYIPSEPGRTIWPTLNGVTPTDLLELYKD
jgi:HAD superfamily hydrolase (TIGR01509 family)